MTQNPEVNFPVLASSSSIYWQSILIVSPDGQITYYGEISGEKMESFIKFSAALIRGQQDQFSPSGGEGPPGPPPGNGPPPAGSSTMVMVSVDYLKEMLEETGKLQNKK